MLRIGIGAIGLGLRLGTKVGQGVGLGTRAKDQGIGLGIRAKNLGKNKVLVSYIHYDLTAMIWENRLSGLLYRWA